MRVVDTAIFEALELAGFWVPALHEDEDPAPTPPAGATIIHDGLVDVDTSTKVVTYALPFVAYYSSVGDDDNVRLSGRRARRSVFFSMTYVGEDRNQTKWAAERVRDAINDKRIPVPGHKTWLCRVEESQRVRRDDDAARTDGSPLFYGVDNGALSITLTH